MHDQFLKAIYSIARRADSADPTTLQKSFVSVGGIDIRISSPDHQIIYGRRGTGKTHTLQFLMAAPPTKWMPVFIDLRKIGSNRSLYIDKTLSPEVRATTLLVDFLQALHNSLLELAVIRDDTFDLSKAGPLLDSLATATSHARVIGPKTIVTAEKLALNDSEKASATVNLASTPSASATQEHGFTTESEKTKTTTEQGDTERYVIFGEVASAIQNFCKQAAGHKIALLLDEWSDIPLEIQPYLADLIRRTAIASGLIVKIAAIEYNSQFAIVTRHSYIGLQVGADIMADVNLDDFMVFDSDEERAKQFFKDLLYNHYLAAVAEKNEEPVAANAERFILEVFTEKRAFEEFVRAVEGVPRDAINLLMKAASKTSGGKISVDIVRTAARDWYRSDKYAFVEQNAPVSSLLKYIIDDVIAERKARAFLFPSKSRHPLIERLFDSRLLHVLKRNISSKEGGERFDVYKLDYGCYVDLLTTANKPSSLLFDEEEVIGSTIEVPGDDYRAIRRATLDIDKFVDAQPQ